MNNYYLIHMFLDIIIFIVIIYNLFNEIIFKKISFYRNLKNKNNNKLNMGNCNIN